MSYGAAVWLFPDGRARVFPTLPEEQECGIYLPPHPLAGFLMAGSGMKTPVLKNWGYRWEKASDPGMGQFSRTAGLIVSSRKPWIQRFRRTIPNHHSVAFDAKASSRADGVTSLTFAHTLTTNANRYAGVFTYGNGDPFTTMTYAGAALTKNATAVANVAGFALMELWYIIAPATGANNVIVTQTSSGQMAASSISADGVDQTTPHSNTATPTTGNSSTSAITVTSAVGELGIVASAIGSFGTANQTMDATWTTDTDLDTGAGFFLGLGASHKAGAASLTASNGIDTTVQWACVAASLKASGGATGWGALTHDRRNKLVVA